MVVKGRGAISRVFAFPSLVLLFSTLIGKRTYTVTSSRMAGSQPEAIIAPSVLASDFGQLTAECKRVLSQGADWLHMGKFSHAAD
jgi:hypothetical protein